MIQSKVMEFLIELLVNNFKFLGVSFQASKLFF